MNTLRHSLRLRLAVILVGVTAGIIIIGTIINSVFLGNYYITTKQEELIDMYDRIDRMYYKDPITGNIKIKTEDLQHLRERSYSLGIQMIIVDTSYRVRFENVPSTDDTDVDNLLTRMQKLVFNVDTESKDILRKTSEYELYKYTYNKSGAVYVEMWGELECGYLFLMRFSNEAVMEVVNVVNKFYLNVGLILTMLGILATGFIASRVTKPIRELAVLSKKMSNLEFDVKYTGKAKDEIGVLGESMNEMSYTLEKTISELKTANNELKRDIEKKTEIDELRKEFISNVSHELKTPIAIIQGYAEGLKESVNDDPESMEFYCDVIVDESAKMNKMVKKLLTLNQIEFGNVVEEYERFNIVEIIDNILNQTQLLLKEKEAIVDFDNSKQIYVWSDEFQVEEVLTNYISNAINHLDNEKIIKIRVIEQGKTVRISVENTGENIPKESLSRIWEKFYKVDKARTREYGGSGIGLSIVKAIMNSLHMQCGVENTSRGVMFWFELESANETAKDIKESVELFN